MMEDGWNLLKTNTFLAKFIPSHMGRNTRRENKNGIFINITKLTDTTLTQLEEYINYVNTQEEHLNKIEEQKKLITRESCHLFLN